MGNDLNSGHISGISGNFDQPGHQHISAFPRQGQSHAEDAKTPNSSPSSSRTSFSEICADSQIEVNLRDSDCAHARPVTANSESSSVQCISPTEFYNTSSTNQVNGGNPCPGYNKHTSYYEHPTALVNISDSKKSCPISRTGFYRNNTTAFINGRDSKQHHHTSQISGGNPGAGPYRHYDYPSNIDDKVSIPIEELHEYGKLVQ